MAVHNEAHRRSVRVLDYKNTWRDSTCTKILTIKFTGQILLFFRNSFNSDIVWSKELIRPEYIGPSFGALSTIQAWQLLCYLNRFYDSYQLITTTHCKLASPFLLSYVAIFGSQLNQPTNKPSCLLAPAVVTLWWYHMTTHIDKFFIYLFLNLFDFHKLFNNIL